MLVVVGAIGLACWWVSRQLNWLAERRLFLRTAGVHMTFGDAQPPWQIRLFGARGYGAVVFVEDPNPWIERDFCNLFPESKIIKHVQGGEWVPTEDLETDWPATQAEQPPTEDSAATQDKLDG